MQGLQPSLYLILDIITGLTYIHLRQLCWCTIDTILPWIRRGCLLSRLTVLTFKMVQTK